MPNSIFSEETMEMAHHGVPGMHWGKHTAGKSTPSSGGSSKAAAKPANPKEAAKAASVANKARLKALDQKAKAKINAGYAKKDEQRKADNLAGDKAILDARAGLKGSRAQVKAAKKQYVIDKQKVGKVAAKQTLNKVKNQHMDMVNKAMQDTEGEATQRAVMNLIAASAGAGSAYYQSRN